MRFDIEITEDEIRDVVTGKVRAAISAQSTRWTADEHIKNQVKDKWPAGVDAIIAEELKNIQAIREKVVSEIERLLRAKITAAMRAAK